MGIVAKKSTSASQVSSSSPSFVMLMCGSHLRPRPTVMLHAVRCSVLQRALTTETVCCSVMWCVMVCCSVPRLCNVLQWPAQAKCCSVRCNVHYSVHCSVHCVCVAVCVAVCIAVCRVAVCVEMCIFATDLTMYRAYLSKPAYLAVCVGARAEVCIAAMCVLIGRA